MRAPAAVNLRTDVSALYVDPRGPYPLLVEHWYDEARDARDRSVAKHRGVCPPGIKMCSAEQRRRTPRAFAEWLLHVASRASRSRAA